MKKETLIAIILGITMGAVIAFVLISTTKRKEIGGNKVITPAVSPTIFKSVTKGEILTISEPKNELSTAKGTITIKGKGKKDSLLVIQSATAEKTIKLSKEEFSIEYPIVYGENVVRITAYSGSDSYDKLLKIYRIEE